MKEWLFVFPGPPQSDLTTCARLNVLQILVTFHFLCPEADFPSIFRSAVVWTPGQKGFGGRKRLCKHISPGGNGRMF